MEPSTAPIENQTESPLDAIKTPKNAKEARYYYKHREEILVKQKAIREALKAARESDPEYQAKLKQREEEKAKKREENLKRRMQRERERKKERARETGREREQEKKLKEEEREKKRQAILENLTKTPGT